MESVSVSPIRSRSRTWTAEGWAELAALIEGSRARILLEGPDMFTTSLTLPKAARRRLKSAVALQLSQVAPVDPSLLRWATRSTDGTRPDPGRRGDGARRSGREASGTVRDKWSRAAAGVRRDGREPIELAAGRRVAVTAPNQAGTRAWVVAALLIASIPLTTALGATILRATAESRIDMLEKSAGPRLREEARARRSEELRRGLRPLVGRPGVSATLEDVATRLAMTDHVVSLRQSGDRILDLTVEAADAEAVEVGAERIAIASARHRRRHRSRERWTIQRHPPDGSAMIATSLPSPETLALGILALLLLGTIQLIVARSTR